MRKFVHKLWHRLTRGCWKPWKVFTVLRISSGAYTEYATAPTVFTAKLPAGLSFEDGAALGVPYFTAYRALVSVGGGKKGDKVLIHGASGGVGVACMQIAKFLGMDVYGTASTEAGLSLIKDHNCHPFNHREEGPIRSTGIHVNGVFTYMIYQ